MTTSGPQFLGGRCCDCNQIIGVIDRRPRPHLYSAARAMRLVQRMATIQGMVREHRKDCRGRGTETKP